MQKVWQSKSWKCRIALASRRMRSLWVTNLLQVVLKGTTPSIHSFKPTRKSAAAWKAKACSLSTCLTLQDQHKLSFMERKYLAFWCIWGCPSLLCPSLSTSAPPDTQRWGASRLGSPALWASRSCGASQGSPGQRCCGSSTDLQAPREVQMPLRAKELKGWLSSCSLGAARSS